MTHFFKKDNFFFFPLALEAHASDGYILIFSLPI
jgi:hypothetical protein